MVHLCYALYDTCGVSVVTDPTCLALLRVPDDLVHDSNTRRTLAVCFGILAVLSENLRVA